MAITNVLDYLENAVKVFPEKVAFVDEEHSLTFTQLMDTAKRIGSFLAENATNRNPIPVYMKKSVEEVAAFMGVVYSGRAYAPVDPQMPEKRVARILATLEAETVIADEECAGILRQMNYEGKIYMIDDLSKYEINEPLLAQIRRAAIDCDLLYIIFTSGSTGNPKGVALNHRSIINFVEWYSKTAGFDSTCVFGNQAPFYFDVSVKDIYSTLKHGATTYIIPKKLFSFPQKLFEYINQNQINTIAWSASAIALSSKEAIFEKVVPSSLRVVCFGGEALPVKLLNIWKKYLPNAFYMNMYGPTETSVDCTYHIVDNNKEYTTPFYPIGRACENTDVFLLNGDRLAGPGETGEVCVRGASLACGYYNDPEKTAESFVQNPLQKAYPELIYRTKDIGYYDENGEIVFASRKDDQIKHMGYRIELGEIEAALSDVEGITRCCCLYNKSAGKIVCIYTGAVTKQEIILELKKAIPKYMWPNTFIQLDELPLNLNGKIDRTKLKAEYIDG